MHHLTKKMTALALFAVLALFPATNLLAGSPDFPDSPAEPTDPGSAMYTLEDIYNRLNTNTQATKRAGGFTEPGAGPASTGRTLDEVYEKAIPTQIPKTGQSTCWDADGDETACAGTGQDGALQKGVAWPNPRFTDNGDGTVTDNLTSLMWLKDADCDGTKTWAYALAFANGLAHGQCGLDDGSAAGDWWLPNLNELRSLIDASQYTPALSTGHPFTGVQSYHYWSSTNSASHTGNAWNVSMLYGNVFTDPKTVAYHVWPVRAGQ